MKKIKTEYGVYNVPTNTDEISYLMGYREGVLRAFEDFANYAMESEDKTKKTEQLLKKHSEQRKISQKEMLRGGKWN